MVTGGIFMMPFILLLLLLTNTSTLSCLHDLVVLRDVTIGLPAMTMYGSGFLLLIGESVLLGIIGIC